MGRMFHVHNYVTVLKVKLSGAADRSPRHRNPDHGFQQIVRFKFHRAPAWASAGGSRATTQDFPNRCTQRNTTGLALSLEGTRRTHSRSHKSRMTT
jgi:hypothetical protein